MVVCCFFNDTATTEIYTYCHTLSLHDALPISVATGHHGHAQPARSRHLAQFHTCGYPEGNAPHGGKTSPPAQRQWRTLDFPEEIGRAHVLTPVTNAHLVCRLLLEQTKQIL